MSRFFFVFLFSFILSCSQKEHIMGFSEDVSDKPIVCFKDNKGVFYHYKKNPNGKPFSDSEFLTDTISFTLTSNDIEKLQKAFVEEEIDKFDNANTDILLDTVFVSERDIPAYRIHTNKRVIVIEPQCFTESKQANMKKTKQFNKFYKALENILSLRIEEGK